MIDKIIIKPLYVLLFLLFASLVYLSLLINEADGINFYIIHLMIIILNIIPIRYVWIMMSTAVLLRQRLIIMGFAVKIIMLKRRRAFIHCSEDILRTQGTDHPAAGRLIKRLIMATRAV